MPADSGLEFGALRKISEEGTEFRSHIDGSLQFLSPEVSMEVQAALGSDIVMVFDECAPGQASHEEARTSLELTARWSKRSRARFDELQSEGADMGFLAVGDNENSSLAAAAGRMPALQGELSGAQALFGIVQGAAHMDLRRESLERTLEIGFDGTRRGISLGRRSPSVGS